MTLSQLLDPEQLASLSSEEREALMKIIAHQLDADPEVQEHLQSTVEEIYESLYPTTTA